LLSIAEPKSEISYVYKKNTCSGMVRIRVEVRVRVSGNKIKYVFNQTYIRANDP